MLAPLAGTRRGCFTASKPDTGYYPGTRAMGVMRLLSPGVTASRERRRPR
jgi:hypothetical protein